VPKPVRARRDAPDGPTPADGGDDDAAARRPGTGGGAAGVSWGLGDALVGWLLALVGANVTASLVLAINDRSPDELDELSLGWVALAQVGRWVGFLGVPLVVARLKGRGLVADFGLRARLEDTWVGGFWGAFTQLVLAGLLYAPIFWFTDLHAEDLREPAEQLTDRATDPFGVAMLVLIVGIGAPIFEEIFYRGLVLRSMERRVGTWPAVVVTGVLFGLSHLQLLQLPALILFGIVAGVLTVRSGRLGPAIAAHVVFNLVAVVTLLQGT
jgi:membrane protease YdiL (CAAX protease family)